MRPGTPRGLDWPQSLKNIVFLGTPHHGAPLERAGNWIDVILGSTPYSRPFAKLGQLRSAGITDLRYGHVLEPTGKAMTVFRRKPDSRQPVPLPKGVACYTVAATPARQRSLLADRLVGDGLVPLHSALGQHDDAHTQSGIRPGRAAHCLPHEPHGAAESPGGGAADLVQWLTPRPLKPRTIAHN